MAAIKADSKSSQWMDAQGSYEVNRNTLNKNELSLTIKSQPGGTWLDAEFNAHQNVRHVLELSIAHFHLDSSRTYEVLLVRGSEQRSLPLEASLQEAGVEGGDQLLIRTVGRTVDG